MEYKINQWRGGQIMNIKRLVYILIGVVLISFGLGALSLRYNDNFRFEKIRWSGINIRGNGNVKIDSQGIEVKDGRDHVIIDWDGIKVNDGKDKVSIGWDGIKVDDGEDKVSIGWDGIKIQEGDKSKINIGDWFVFDKDLKWVTIDEEKSIKVDGIEAINISSDFIDIKVSSVDRDDIKVKYSGSMETNVVPKLKIEEKSDEIEIKLENENSYTVRESDVFLEVFIPKDYNKNINIAGSSSDIDIENLVIENLNIYSSSGDIDIENISGKSFNILSSSGYIEIEDSVGEMNLQSSSGDIELDNRKNTEDIKIDSSSGDISIEFGKSPNYIIKGSSSSGEFRSSFPMSIEENNEKSFKALIGQGDNTIEVNTSSGDIKLIKD